jgi:hypothetical protein
LQQLEVLMAAPALPDTGGELPALPEPADDEPDEEALTLAPPSSETRSLPQEPADGGQEPALRETLDSISVRRAADGRVTIEAHPEAAQLLLAMLEKTAALLRSSL